MTRIRPGYDASAIESAETYDANVEKRPQPCRNRAMPIWEAIRWERGAQQLTVFDAAHSEFEERWFTLGTSSTGSLLAVSHTYQHTGPIHVKVRLISARPATRAERKQYENEPR